MMGEDEEEEEPTTTAYREHEFDFKRFEMVLTRKEIIVLLIGICK